MLENIINWLFGTNSGTISHIIDILTLWTFLFIGIASFFQIKSYFDVKKKSKETAEKVAKVEAEKHVAEFIRNFKSALITRMTVVTDLSIEFSEYRGNAWTKLADALFSIIDEPTLGIDDTAKEKIKEKFYDEKQKIFNISYELSYLLQLFDKEAARREVARAYVRDHGITRAISLLHSQLHSPYFEKIEKDENDDIIRTMKKLEKTNK